MLYGIIADKILENAYIPLKELDVPPPTISGIGAEFILGIARDGTIVLDGSTLLGTRTIIVDQQEKNKQL
jgi:purine-binding chemotaxis protein CheW